jgi:tetratricopeptide (TPR) repeat protein
MKLTTTALSDDELVAVGTICRRLDGIPLGLELAAARSRTIPLEALADRLERSIDQLASSRHGVTPRHRTMRAVLDWGYELLTPSAQAALRAMSVFSGGCQLEAFGAVCVDGDGSPDELLDELVRTSFVVVDFDARPPRYRLLEPVRHYAAERLDVADERDQRQGAHLQHFLDVAVDLDRLGNEPGSVPFEQFQRELGNFRVALDWAAQDAELAGVGLRLAACLYFLWTTGSRESEGVERIVNLLHSRGGSPDARSRAASIAGIVAAHLDDAELTRCLCEQSLEEALAGASDPVYEGRARQLLAHLYALRGDIPAARNHLEAAMQLHSERADEGLHEFCLASKALIDEMTGDLDDATAACQELLDTRFAATEWIGNVALGTLGRISCERGDLDRARSWLTQALALAESLGGVPRDAVCSHLDLVDIECGAGHLEEAEAHFAAALELSPSADRGTDLRFLLAGAELALHRGDPTRAVDLAAAALARADESSMAHDRCRSLRVLGDAQLAVGDVQRASTTFEDLIASARSVPYPCRVAEGHEGAAAAAAALDRQETARTHLAAAAEIRQHTNTRRVDRQWIETQLASLAGAETC